jgi:hypothetical protein
MAAATFAVCTLLLACVGLPAAKTSAAQRQGTLRAAGPTTAERTAPLPGVVDVCSHMPQAAERCSPEICSIEPHSTVRLQAKTYYQNASLVLPEGSHVIGAGINKTTIISCKSSRNSSVFSCNYWVFSDGVFF